jgi:hypothetical protein
VFVLDEFELLDETEVGVLRDGDLIWYFCSRFCCRVLHWCANWFTYLLSIKLDGSRSSAKRKALDEGVLLDPINVSSMLNYIHPKTQTTHTKS